MKLKELKPNEMHQLSGYLEAVSDFLRTGEIRWNFEVRLFEVDVATFDLIEFLKEVYPDSKPRPEKICNSSLEGILTTLKHELDLFASSELRGRIRPVTTGTGEMWIYLQQCIDLKDCRFYEYMSSERDEILNGLMGDLAIILLNERLARCLLLLAATSD